MTLLIILIVVLVAAGAAYYWFFMRAKGAGGGDGDMSSMPEEMGSDTMMSSDMGDEGDMDDAMEGGNTEETNQN